MNYTLLFFVFFGACVCVRLCTGVMRVAFSFQLLVVSCGFFSLVSCIWFFCLVSVFLSVKRSQDCKP